ncbi:hypothetical protein PHMEG_0005311 [Phytophthora megakarya]|uniref:ZSWIM1/3 RNaseH-like domain-containing protein n=1 Tax=Phytophthora megakarya TaxID=4795 RepID=A0A225WRN9_9STRA|nr:hypothetical protein PHMEG_0005311 [Phytophthora megakarya]
MTPPTRRLHSESGESTKERLEANRRWQNRNFFPSLDDSSSSETDQQRRRHVCVERIQTLTPRMDVIEVVAREELVLVPPLDVPSFDNWKALETYLKSYILCGLEPLQGRAMLKSSPLFRVVTKFQTGCSFTIKPTSARTLDQRECGNSVEVGVLINILDGKLSSWEVVITKNVTTHNHDVGPDVYQTYHQASQVLVPDILDGVHLINREGVNLKRILEYIIEKSSVQPEIKNVHNLEVQLKRESYEFPTVEERVNSILDDVNSEKGNMAKGVAECILLQTSHMRTSFENFPVAQLIDATHDTNISN